MRRQYVEKKFATSIKNDTINPLRLSTELDFKHARKRHYNSDLRNGFGRAANLSEMIQTRSKSPHEQKSCIAFSKIHSAHETSLDRPLKKLGIRTYDTGTYRAKETRIE